MKISEARQLYSTQIKAYHEQQVILSKQKKDLEGKNLFAEEAATLELTLDAVIQKKNEYQDYMSKINEHCKYSSAVCLLSPLMPNALIRA